jgi:wyosine [tRNA(Phe)-imidazoG37] synthetase (radical SAM superfamily)
MISKFQYIYGPVYSWRVGWSLGIDPISRPEKICNFDCVYCQLGPTALQQEDRKVFIHPQDIVQEIQQMPNVKLVYLTFSGRGEPTLAANLGEMIVAVKALGIAPVAVITNSALMSRPDVRTDLSKADFVVAKLDACDEASFRAVNHPHSNEHFIDMLDGLKKFRQEFNGKLALQIMFVDENRSLAPVIANIVESINADEIQINTPLRPSGAVPLEEKEILKIKTFFHGKQIKTVYESPKEVYDPFSEHDTISRHGQFRSQND